MQYTEEDLKKIIENHQHWLQEDRDGWKDMRADFTGAILRDANLVGANLRGAILRDANLVGANLRDASLRDANLRDANLRGANLRDAILKDANLKDASLRDANLRGAILDGANLRGASLGGAILDGASLRDANLRGASLVDASLGGANLRDASLRDANLRDANLRDANLRDANLEDASLEGASLGGTSLDENEKYRLGQILKEPMTGYKKTREGIVITATIPAGAIVFCINGSKCRTNLCTITDMGGKDVLHSLFDSEFEYRLGQEIDIEDFDLMYNVECASGFHFFWTREEAEKYHG